MEDPEPQLRESLKEMIFSENVFDWKRLEELIESTKSKVEINLETLTIQILDYLYSSNGQVLRDEVTSSMNKKLDSYGWQAIKKINQILPTQIKSTRIECFEHQKNKTSPLSKIFLFTQNIPGFELKIILNQLPRLFFDRHTREMTLTIA